MAGFFDWLRMSMGWRSSVPASDQFDYLVAEMSEFTGPQRSTLYRGAERRHEFTGAPRSTLFTVPRKA